MVELPVVSVWKIIKLNEQSKFPDKFEDFISETVADEKIEFQKVNQDDLNRFDKRKRQKDNKRQNRSRERNG
jgi:hypothetical protein